jgi:peroxiredoxin
MMRYRALAGCIAATLIASIGTLAARAASLQPNTIAAVPAFSLRRADAAGVVSPTMFAGRPAVLIFWGSWCDECRAEAPALVRAYGRFAGSGVAFIGIAVDDTMRAAMRVARAEGLAWPQALDPNGTTAAAFGFVGVPATVFVGADGRIDDRRLGAATDAILRRGIARISHR